MPRFAANLTMLFQEIEFPDRFQLAAEAGFEGVEYLFPFGWDKTELRQRLDANGLTQVLHNLPPGDWEAGERGIACLPDRREEFRQGISVAIEYAETLGCKQLNCLAGIKPDSLDERHAWDTLLANLEYASSQLASHDIRLLVEPINSRVDIPGFFIDTLDKGLSLVEALGYDRLGLQFDIYHMQIMGGDLWRRLSGVLDKVDHIQFADNPGRHEPGTGEIAYPFLFQQLDLRGYNGWVSAEYIPSRDTKNSLAWLFNEN